MLGSELGGERAGRASLTAPGFFQALADSFSCVRARGDVQEALVCLGILYDRRCFAVDGEHDWTLRLVELFQEVARSPAESGQRMDVLRDVEHGGVRFH